MNKFLFLVIVGLVLCFEAMSATIPLQQNIKLPSQEVLQHVSEIPVVGASFPVATSFPGSSNSFPSTVVVSIKLDVPRNLVVTPVSNTAAVKAGVVTVNGINVNAQLISEDFTFADSASAPVTGNKAFALITSIVYPGEYTPYNASWTIVAGNKLGLSKCLDGAGYFDKGLVDGVLLVSPTLATDSTHVELNTITPNPLPNSVRLFDYLFVQNFRCD